MQKRPTSRSNRGKTGTADGAGGELNLVPIMSMLVILIPVLLVAFTFVEIKIESATAPRMALPGDNAKAPVRVPTVYVGAGGAVQVRGFEGELYASLDPATEGLVDAEELATTMEGLQKQSPTSNKVRIAAAPSVPWHVMARCLDATRGAPDGAQQGRFEDVVLMAPTETPPAL